MVGTKGKPRSPPPQNSGPAWFAWCHLFISSLPLWWWENLSEIALCYRHHSKQAAATTDLIVWIFFKLVVALTLVSETNMFLSMAKPWNIYKPVLSSFPMWLEYSAKPKCLLLQNEFIFQDGLKIWSSLTNDFIFSGPRLYFVRILIASEDRSDG